MEAVMIANPKHAYYQYNPYTKRISIEKYDYEFMIKTRQEELARSTISQSTVVGVIMSVLGRQGSTYITDVTITLLEEDNRRTQTEEHQICHYIGQ